MQLPRSPVALSLSFALGSALTQDVTVTATTTLTSYTCPCSTTSSTRTSTTSSTTTTPPTTTTSTTTTSTTSAACATYACDSNGCAIPSPVEPTCAAAAETATPGNHIFSSKWHQVSSVSDFNSAVVNGPYSTNLIILTASWNSPCGIVEQNIVQNMDAYSDVGFNLIDVDSDAAGAVIPLMDVYSMPSVVLYVGGVKGPVLSGYSESLKWQQAILACAQVPDGSSCSSFS